MKNSIFKTFAKDYAARMARTALQVFFGSIMVGATDGAFTDSQVEQVVGAVLLVASLVPTGFSAWKVAREKRATELLMDNQPERAKAVVITGKDFPKKPTGLY